jgi:hypothetical protein
MNLRDHVSIIEKRKINSYYDQFQNGDFVVHFAGYGNGKLVEWLEGVD